MKTTKHYKSIFKTGIYFVFEPVICAFNQKHISLVEGGIGSSKAGSASQAFSGSSLHKGFLPVVPICGKLGFTKLMAKTQVAAATATRAVRQVEAAMGIK